MRNASFLIIVLLWMLRNVNFFADLSWIIYSILSTIFPVLKLWMNHVRQPFCNDSKKVPNMPQRIKQQLLLVFKYESNCLHEGPVIQMGCLCGNLSKESQTIFTRVSEKTTENFERLGRQEQLEIEPGTSHLPVLSAEPLGHW